MTQMHLNALKQKKKGNEKIPEIRVGFLNPNISNVKSF